MKRSEMIALLKAEFSESAYYHIDDAAADRILECLELAGMEPPKMKRKVTLEKRLDQNHIFSYVEYVNQWESEDE